MPLYTGHCSGHPSVLAWRSARKEDGGEHLGACTRHPHIPTEWDSSALCQGPDSLTVCYMYFAHAALMNKLTACFPVQSTVPTLFSTFNIYCSFVRKYLLGNSVTMFLKYVTNRYMVFLLSTSAVSKDVLQLNSLGQLPLSMFSAETTLSLCSPAPGNQPGESRSGEARDTASLNAAPARAVLFDGDSACAAASP